MSGGERPEPDFAALQAWFARVLEVPFPLDSTGNPLEATAPGLRAEAEALIAGHGGFSGFDRVGVYNRQYWFRLVDILQGAYPCAVHLLGLPAFNALAIRYLAAHPPASPYLARLDDAWPGFLGREYRGSDREALLQAVAVDRAFSLAMDAPDGEPLSARGLGQAVEPPADLSLKLAPHATMLALDFDFPAYRALCLADESLEGRFELSPCPLILLIWRGADAVIWQKPVPPSARLVLAQFRESTRLDAAFERLEAHLEASVREDLEANLAGWFAEWTREGILVRGE